MDNAAAGVKKPKRRYDRSALEKAVHHLSDSPAFCALIEHQQRIDDLTIQRRAAVREALGRPERMRTRIRVTITHVQHPAELATQPSQVLTAQGPGIASRQGSLGDPSRGALVPAPSGGSGLPVPPATPAAPTLKQPFTSYLRTVQVTLRPLPSRAPSHDPMDTDGPGDSVSPAPQDTQQDVRTLVWDRALHVGAHFRDCVEVRFQGTGAFSQGAQCSVQLCLEDQPERHVVPSPLDTLLGVTLETKTRLVNLLSQYLRKARLLDRDQTVTVDKPLAEVLDAGEGTTLSYEAFLTAVFSRLQTVPPLTVDYTIRLSPPSGPIPPSTPASVHDIECDTLGPLNPTTERQAHAVLERCAPDKEIETLDTEMAGVMRKLAEHRRRRAMLMGFAQSPVDYMAAMLATQAKDVRVKELTKNVVGQNVTVAAVAQTVMGPNPLLRPPVNAQLNTQIATVTSSLAKEYEAQRYTELFKGRWVEDAAVSYLDKRARQMPLAHAPQQM